MVHASGDVQTPFGPMESPASETLSPQYFIGVQRAL